MLLQALKKFLGHIFSIQIEGQTLKQNHNPWPNMRGRHKAQQT